MKKEKPIPTPRLIQQQHHHSIWEEVNERGVLFIICYKDEPIDRIYCCNFFQAQIEKAFLLQQLFTLNPLSNLQ